MHRYTHIFYIMLFLYGCQAKEAGQTVSDEANTAAETPDIAVGGFCDGCDIMYKGMPEQGINQSDTSAGWFEEEGGQKLLVSGTVYARDGKTPAAGVMLYYWHTDNTGQYIALLRKGQSVQHGRMRGWVKTNLLGQYEIYTIRPAPYPRDVMPAHIHVVVKEPGIQAYYIDDFVFDDDKLLTAEKRKAMENRGGNGILTVKDSAGLQRAQHDVVLGLNVPGYPVE